MDATHRNPFRYAVFGLFSALILTALGCGNNSGTVNTASAQCTSQMVKNSFLVKWNEAVPAEYSAYKVGPNSLVTRFSGIQQSEVEKNVLQKHLTEYMTAEPEFYVKNVIEDQVKVKNTAPSPTSAWGPGDVEASQAWSYLGEEGAGVTVAVVDSGIDINHPLLQGQLWVNAGEIPNNGIDDDHDGYVDDYNGYDFADNDADLSDGANHGTHVSGIIAGLAGASSFTGIAPGAKIMVLKFINATGNGSVGNAIAAVEYAAAHGAKVINASWGGSDCSSVLQQEIITSTLSGTVFSNAAGNSGDNLTTAPEWPAAFQIQGKITVASYNVLQVLSSFSNFGPLVDLAGPGENILSTVPPSPGQPEGQLAFKSGTSMATPFITGVAALLYAARPTASATDIVNAINGGVMVGPAFDVRTNGKINALTAAQYLMSH